MYYITIDCGTTNSRAYVVDSSGRVISRAKKTVGVRDTATTGSRDTLRRGLREIISAAIQSAGLTNRDIKCVLSSGMITSEIGLMEIPHCMAPCGIDDLASSITCVEDAGIIDDVPVFLIRGIKNHMVTGERRATAQVGELDFMRGEETQLAGIMHRRDFVAPSMVVMLSSHTKFCPINKEGILSGCLTTMSGQAFDAILNHTFVGKSVEKRENAEQEPDDYFDEAIVCDAIEWVNKVGLLRTFMFPRFLDVLLDTKWYERMLFFEASVAADDMLCLQQMDRLAAEPAQQYYLIGAPGRCRLYAYILRKCGVGCNITSICGAEDIDDLSVQGILMIAGKAGIL